MPNNVKTWVWYLIQEEAKGNLPQILENSICYDGIILKDTKNSDYIKLVAQKQTKEGKNYYKIFSNSKIQNKEVLSGDIRASFINYKVGSMVRGKQNSYTIKKNNNSRGIGVEGLINIFGMKKIKYKINRNYLILSLGILEKMNSYKKRYCKDEFENLEKCMKDNGISIEKYPSTNDEYDYVQNIFTNIINTKGYSSQELWDYYSSIRAFKSQTETDIPIIYLVNNERGEAYVDNVTDKIMEQKDQMELIKILSKCQISEKLSSKEQNNKEMDDEIEI